MNTTNKTPMNKIPIKTSNRPPTEISTKALDALIKSNEPPTIFIRAGNLVRFRQDENEKPIIDMVNVNILRYELNKAAEFFVWKNEVKTPKSPPLTLIQDILAMEQWEGLPALSGVIQSPVVKPGGDILNEPGYDPDTKLYYLPAPELEIPEIPKRPSKAEVEKAKAILDETICDFPFATKADRDNTLGLFITPFVRPLISGPVPLAIVSAPLKGSGKTLLGQICSLIATGHSPHMLPYSVSEEENRKKITAALLGGHSIIEFDNVKKRLDSSALDSALTAYDWEDRILGQSKTISIPQRATWIANGNNLQIGDELTRRIYPIYLTPTQSKPWLRTHFRHKKLLNWVKENRAKLIWAILILVQDWNNAGNPLCTDVILGNFTEWVEVVGGVLSNAGYKHFLNNLEEAYDEFAEEETQWETLLDALYKEFNHSWFSTNKFTQLLEENTTFLDILPDKITEVWDGSEEITLSHKREIGKIFSKKVDRPFGEKRLHLEKKKDKHEKVNVWKVSCGVAG